MPSIICQCGQQLRFGEIPCPIEWLIISDKEFDMFSDNIDREELYKSMKSILKCSECGRLWVYWEGFSIEPIEYVPVKPNGA